MRISFPHPVLGNADDFPGVVPVCPVKWSVADGVLRLAVGPATANSPTIDTMVQNGKASWFVRVHCPRTYFRQEFRLTGTSREILLETEQLDGRVQIETFVATSSPETGYAPSGIHRDYLGETFQLATGAVLAEGPSFDQLIDPQFDPLKAPVASFLRVEEGDFETGPFTVIWDDDLFVRIKLSRQDWKSFHQYKEERFAGVLHSALVLPVLSAAILRAAEQPDSKWAQRLNAIVTERHLPVDDTLTSAQTILRSPLTRCFDALGALIARGE